MKAKCYLCLRGDIYFKMKETENEVLSKTVAFLRFPLIVLVVFAHTNLGEMSVGGVVYATEGAYPVFRFIDRLFVGKIVQLAVPLFFFISGYFFFLGGGFCWKAYGYKLKKRVRTLLVPYLFWNLCAVVLLWLSQLFLASMLSGESKSVAEYGGADWLSVFWHFRDEMPACGAFWFIRELMVLCVLSPFVYLILRRTGRWGICLIGAMYLAGWLPPCTTTRSIDYFYFFWGAWFAIYGKNFIVSFKPYLVPSLCAYCLLVTLCLLVSYDILPGLSEWWGVWHRMGIVAGVMGIMPSVAYGISSGKLRISRILLKSTFFVYAYHQMVCVLFVKCWLKFFQPLTDGLLVIGFFVLPLCVSALGVLLFMTGQRCCPRLLAWTTGGR